jgi:hypothetical protein
MSEREIKIGNAIIRNNFTGQEFKVSDIVIRTDPVPKECPHNFILIYGMSDQYEQCSICGDVKQ